MRCASSCMTQALNNYITWLDNNATSNSIKSTLVYLEAFNDTLLYRYTFTKLRTSFMMMPTAQPCQTNSTQLTFTFVLLTTLNQQPNTVDISLLSSNTLSCLSSACLYFAMLYYNCFQFSICTKLNSLLFVGTR